MTNFNIDFVGFLIWSSFAISIGVLLGLFVAILIPKDKPTKKILNGYIQFRLLVG